MISSQKQPQSQNLQTKTDELILVIKRDLLFPDGAWQGIQKEGLEKYIERIAQYQEFQPRSLMETDELYKQVIPYLIFTHENRFFLMQRSAKASEKRLQSKYTLGIGGHVRREDIEGKDLIHWADREFHEEISYNDNLRIEPIGLLNDDSNAVSRVHVGLVYLVHGDSANISIKSELSHGFLATIQACKNHAPYMETWSQLVLDYIIKQQ